VKPIKTTPPNDEFHCVLPILHLWKIGGFVITGLSGNRPSLKLQLTAIKLSLVAGYDLFLAIATINPGSH
jgi:hypothetical protein